MLVVLASAGVVVARTAPVLRRTAALLALAATVGGLWVLATVSDRQQERCGDVLPQCEDLLPGL